MALLLLFLGAADAHAQGAASVDGEPPPAGYGASVAGRSSSDSQSSLLASVDSPQSVREPQQRQILFRRSVEEAMSSYRKGDFVATARAYIEAYRVQPEPLLLFNAAQALRKGEVWEDSLNLYQRFIAIAPKSPMVPEAEANSASVRASLEVKRIHGQLGAAEQEASRRRQEAERLARENAEKTQQNQALLLRVREGKPVYKRPWFWVTLGGGIVAVAGLAIGLGVALSPKVADGSLGNVPVAFP